MKKKPFLILILPALILVSGYLIRQAIATSNPHTWTNGLVGYWSFDGQNTTSTNGTRDVSNNNNWGAFNGGVTPIGGISGQALSFDGINDYVDAGAGSSLNITGTALTIELWIKPTNIAAGYIITKTDSAAVSPYWQYELEFNGDGKIRFGGDMDGAPANKDSTGGIPANQWSHVVVTYDGSNVTYYFNGVYDSAPALTGNLMTHPTWELWMGDAAWDSTNFSGLLDEVRIYNRALSVSEVKQHYNQTKRNFVVNQPSGTPPVGWWKMDESPTSNGSIIHDYSANANNGTVSNGGYGVTSTDGKIGKSLSFDGTSDYVKVLDNDNLDLVTAHTMEAWIKVDSFSGYRTIISKSNGGSGGKGWMFNIDGANSRLQQWLITGSDNYISYYSATFTAGVWHYISVTYDSSLVLADKVKFYIDGVATAVTSAQTGAFTGIGTNALNVNMGSYGDGAGQFFNGLLDDVRIYNYARTADQIAADFRAGAYRTTIAASNPNDWSNGLVGYWSFDGQYTTSTNGTRDVSGNGNWATFQNGTKPIAGISGQALSFDGNNDYADAGNGASVRLTSAISIEAWVRFTGWPKPNPSDAREHIVAKGREGAGLPDTALAYSAAVETYSLTDERLYFFIYHNSSVSSYIDYTSSEGFRKDYGNWHHYAFTWDGTTNANGIKLYIDGSLRDQKAASATGIQNATSNLQFGFAETFYGNLYGSLDEVRLYNRALSTNEVEQHYQQTRRNLGL